MTITVRQGIKRAQNGALQPGIHDGPAVFSAALSGADYPGLRPAMAVGVGDTVALGQVLFTDRAHPQICFVSPMAGVVDRIELGARRTLSAVVIRAAVTPGAVAGAAAQPVTAPVTSPMLSAPSRISPSGADAALLRASLQSHGLWPAFHTRPYGRIPAPDARPDAIIVSAIEASPLGPDPRVVLGENMAMFRRGLDLLCLLGDGLVYVAQLPAPESDPEIGSAIDPRIRPVAFSGGSAAGLAGTHVHALHRVDQGGSVWTIGYQDVTAIGHLIETGTYLAQRVVALAGPAIGEPRLIRTILGASTADIVASEAAPGTAVLALSGDIISGRTSAWLGRYDRQITVLQAQTPAPPSRVFAAISRLFGGTQAPRAIIPTSALDAAWPFDTAPVPLMRALSVGDADAARALGCLGLVEEDVAALSCLCSSGADYGALLRDVLTKLEQDA